MGVNPDFKKLFPNKTDNEIIFSTYNPCEHCDFYPDNEKDCSENCVIGKLWEIVKDKLENSY